LAFISHVLVDGVCFGWGANASLQAYPIEGGNRFIVTPMKWPELSNVVSATHYLAHDVQLFVNFHTQVALQSTNTATILFTGPPKVQMLANGQVVSHTFDSEMHCCAMPFALITIDGVDLLAAMRRVGVDGDLLNGAARDARFVVDASVGAEHMVQLYVEE
jgi:hypothetical protein